MRSLVPIVSWCSCKGLRQSPARGAAPPTTTTVRSPGRRSPGRWPSGAAVKAAASATPHATAPPRSASLRNSSFATAGSNRSSRRLRTIVRSLVMRAGSRQPLVLPAHWTDPHAFEALRHALLVEAGRRHRLGEEVRIDHHVAPVGVLLVDDIEQALLQAALAEVLRARDAALPVVVGVGDPAVGPDLAVEATAVVLRAGREARRGAQLSVHLDAGRRGAHVLFEDVVGIERQRGEQRRVV